MCSKESHRCTRKRQENSAPLLKKEEKRGFITAKDLTLLDRCKAGQKSHPDSARQSFPPALLSPNTFLLFLRLFILSFQLKEDEKKKKTKQKSCAQIRLVAGSYPLTWLHPVDWQWKIRFLLLRRLLSFDARMSSI